MSRLVRGRGQRRSRRPVRPPAPTPPHQPLSRSELERLSLALELRLGWPGLSEAEIQSAVDEVEATGPYHIRYGSRFQLVLRRAVAAITHVARRPLLSIYGGSYFGSGGGYGVVRTSGNCRAVGLVDNGFMAGPAAVEVSDPAVKARYYAVGGDCIGDVREWGEAGEWDPAARRWSDVPGVHRRTKTERLAWLAEVDVPSEDAARREAELDAS